MRCPNCGKTITRIYCGHCKSRLTVEQSADLSAVIKLMNKTDKTSGGKPPDTTHRSKMMLAPQQVAEQRIAGVPPEVITSCVMGTSADLMVSVAALYFRRGLRIADVTYGRGVFWQKLDMTQYEFFPSDLETWREFPFVKNCDCRNLSYEDGSMDVVAYDPPWSRWASGWSELLYRTGSFDLSNDEILALYKDGMREAKRVLRPEGLLLVKCQDVIIDSRQIRNTIIIHQYAIDELGMTDEDRFCLFAQAPRQTFVAESPRHAKHQESYLWVFRK
jgi:hypothetical protein